MDDGLRRFLEAAKERKEQRMPNQERVRQFEQNEIGILKRFAQHCGAGFSVQKTDSFIRVKLIGEQLLISDLDRELKRLIQDENISIMFQVEENQVVMELVLRCFSSGSAR